MAETRKTKSSGKSKTKSRTTTSKAKTSTSKGQRAEPGTGGGGEYYHIEVRPSDNFETFRTQDVGSKGHIQRVAGKRESGSWATVKWLVDKDDAHVSGGKLIPDTGDVRDLLEKLGSEPTQVEGDRFKAKPRPNVRETDKPTAAQTTARRRNIKKAQSTRKNK